MNTCAFAMQEVLSEHRKQHICGARQRSSGALRIERLEDVGLYATFMPHICPGSYTNSELGGSGENVVPILFGLLAIMRLDHRDNKHCSTLCDYCKFDWKQAIKDQIQKHTGSNSAWLCLLCAKRGNWKARQSECQLHAVG